MRHRLFAVIPFAAVLALTACGSDDKKSDDGASESTAAGAPGAGVVVTGLDGLRWDSDTYTATAGDVEVTLRNESSLPHTLLVLDSEGTALHEEIKTSAKGDEASVTIALEPGTYTVLCTISGHSSMNSDLVVS